MNDTKKLHQSVTIIAAIIGAVVTLINLWGGSISPEFMPKIDGLVQLILYALAFYGRVRATTTIS